jgi:hypothetical protein
VNQPLKQARLGRGLSALLGDYAGARNAIEGGEAGMAAEAPSTEDLKDRKSTRLNSSHNSESRMPSSA